MFTIDSCSDDISFATLTSGTTADLTFDSVTHVSSIHTAGTFDFQIQVSTDQTGVTWSWVFGDRHAIATFRATSDDNEFSLEAYNINAQFVRLVFISEVAFNSIGFSLTGCPVTPTGAWLSHDDVIIITTRNADY